MPTYHVQSAKAPPEENSEFVRVPKRRIVVLETLTLAVSSVLLAINAVLSVFSWWGEADALGMGVGTREGLMASRFRTPFSPAAWTFAGWIVVFAAQAAWLLHAWSYTCRQKVERTISPLVYPVFWITCCVNIGYVYAVGHLADELSLALIAVEGLIMCAAVALVAFHLRKLATGLKEVTCPDKWSTHIFSLNGLAFYATWVLLSTLFHVAAVLQNHTDLHPETISTTLFTIVGALSICYFLLEVTILDRYLRYVNSVYVTVIWWLGGTLAEQWDTDFSDISRNDLFAFVLLMAAGSLMLIHLVLIIVFARVRPFVGGGGSDDDDGAALIPY